MNKIISEILEKSTLQVDGISIVDQAKFAELIVKACANAADMFPSRDSSCIADYVGEQMGYGLEEGISTWRCS